MHVHNVTISMGFGFSSLTDADAKDIEASERFKNSFYMSLLGVVNGNKLRDWFNIDAARLPHNGADGHVDKSAVVALAGVELAGTGASLAGDPMPGCSWTPLGWHKTRTFELWLGGNNPWKSTLAVSINDAATGTAVSGDTKTQLEAMRTVLTVSWDVVYPTATLPGTGP